MKYSLVNVKVSGCDRRWTLDRIQKYADHFSTRKFSSVDFIRLNPDRLDMYAINVYDTHGVLAYQKAFTSLDRMIGYIIGSVEHMHTSHIIKELHS